MDTSKYPSEVFWSDEDEGFIALARDLPGCSAFGASREEAARELEFAIAAWIEAAQNAGNSVPAPSRRKERNNAEPSGKFLVRMPKSLHKQLSTQADEEGVSLNHYVVYLLSERHIKHCTETTSGHIAFLTADFYISNNIELKRRQSSASQICIGNEYALPTEATRAAT